MIKMIQRPILVVMDPRRRRSISTALLKSAQVKYSEFNGNTFNDTMRGNFRILGSLIGGAIAMSCFAPSIEHDERKTQCDYKTTSELPNYGSSSDPAFNVGYSSDEEDLEKLILHPIIPPPNQKDEISDPNSSFGKSTRAFATSARTDAPADSLSAEGGNLAIQTHISRVQTLDRQDDKGNVVTTQKMYFYQAPELETHFADKLVLLAGPSSESLGCDVGHLLGVPVNRMDVGKYEDGESRVQVLDSVRGKKVFIIQSTTSTDAVMELLLLVATVCRASAKQVTAVIPYYGYSRQDARRTTREPIAAADIASMLEHMGADRVICMDLHNDTLRGFFKPQTPVEHLVPVPVAAAYFHEELSARYYTDESPTYPIVTVVASHEGNVDRASLFRSALQKLSGQEVELAVLAKSKSNHSESSHNVPHLVGNVQSRVCIIVDDIVSTGTTLVSSIQKLKQSGAESIFAWATHGVFATIEAPERLQAEDALEFLLISNSVQTPLKLPNKIRSLNVAPLLAEAIARSLHHQSISGILSMDKLEQLESAGSRYDAN